jgi:mannose-6-phosphate isomerase-like protein (cupin superfamily)
MRMLWRLNCLFVRNLNECKVITALDGTILRELLNPLHDKRGFHLGYSIAHATISVGKTSLPHRLLEASEVYYILQGRGLMHIDAEKEEVGPGSLIYIPPQATQYLENTGNTDIVFLCIVDPYWQPSDEELVELKE